MTTVNKLANRYCNAHRKECSCIVFRVHNVGTISLKQGRIQLFTTTFHLPLCFYKDDVEFSKRSWVTDREHVHDERGANSCLVENHAIQFWF